MGFLNDLFDKILERLSRHKKIRGMDISTLENHPRLCKFFENKKDGSKNYERWGYISDDRTIGIISEEIEKVEKDKEDFEAFIKLNYPIIDELEMVGFETTIEHTVGEKNFLLIVRKKN